jgi:hypothetical protein
MCFAVNLEITAKTYEARSAIMFLILLHIP